MINLIAGSTAATGTITSGAASVLAFSGKMNYVIVNNNSGAKCYFKINDNATTPTVSATVYDFSLADGAMPFAINDMSISNISVFVAATSGVRIVGWATAQIA